MEVVRLAFLLHVFVVWQRIHIGGVCGIDDDVWVFDDDFEDLVTCEALDDGGPCHRTDVDESALSLHAGVHANGYAVRLEGGELGEDALCELDALL